MIKDYIPVIVFSTIFILLSVIDYFFIFGFNFSILYEVAGITLISSFVTILLERFNII